MKTLIVLSIKQNKIKNRYVKVENKKSLMLSLLLAIVVGISSYALVLTNNYTKFSDTFSQVYNPINSLYNNMGDVIFTGSTNGILENRTLKMIVPIKSTHINNVNGELHFVVDNSIMIMSPEDGIISEIGMLISGEKFIEIRHTNSVTTRIENIDVTGVIINQAVKKGKEIATGKLGETVRLSVYKDSAKISNLTISKNTIIWEN